MQKVVHIYEILMRLKGVGGGPEVQDTRSNPCTLGWSFRDFLIIVILFSGSVRTSKEKLTLGCYPISHERKRAIF